MGNWDLDVGLVVRNGEDWSGSHYISPIERSVGSGNSTTIAGLAHRFASRHHDQNQRVVDSVIAMRDRQLHAIGNYKRLFVRTIVGFPQVGYCWYSTAPMGLYAEYLRLRLRHSLSERSRG